MTWAVRMVILVVVLSMIMVARKANVSKVLAILVGVMCGLLVFSIAEPATMAAVGVGIRNLLGVPSATPPAG